MFFTHANFSQEAEKLVTLYEACLDDNPRPIEVLMEAISRQDVIDIEDYDYNDEDDDYDNEDPEFFKPI
ncbi:hypothetical protein TorRG33x02_354230 [Trema orientale]|uniref:Uncharacterized protein n=1 Tax=Trema orientale TaxID=63057 RepID=A0A2P5ABH6_TREOI|nr:hypothetical protein TorRG33x02_354230 [Trema orientale]